MTYFLTGLLAGPSKKGLREMLNFAGGVVDVERLLRVEPKIRTGLERRAKLDRKLRRNLSPLVDDPVDDFKIAPNMIRQTFVIGIAAGRLV